MSISTFYHTAGSLVSKAVVSGVGLFYRAASSGITNTGINVKVGGQTIGVMLPNESFKVNFRFQDVILEPQDPNNRAEFKAFETDEDYRTAQVTGLVQVSNFPNTFYSALSTDIQDGGKEFACNSDIANMAGNVLHERFFVNPAISTTSFYLEKIKFLNQDGTLKPGPITAAHFCLFKGILATNGAVVAQSLNKVTMAGLDLNCQTGTTFNFPFTEDEQNVGSVYEYKPPRPIKMSPGSAMRLVLTTTAAAPANSWVQFIATGFYR